MLVILFLVGHNFWLRGECFVALTYLSHKNIFAGEGGLLIHTWWRQNLKRLPWKLVTDVTKRKILGKHVQSKAWKEVKILPGVRFFSVARKRMRNEFKAISQSVETNNLHICKLIFLIFNYFLRISFLNYCGPPVLLPGTYNQRRDSCEDLISDINSVTIDLRGSRNHLSPLDAMSSSPTSHEKTSAII